MSDVIHHECGLAMIRLRKPLSYYQEKYGTPLHGLKCLQLLMRKMRNRGQDGAGMATIKLDHPPGQKFISRRRSNASNYLDDLWEAVYRRFDELPPERLADGEWLKSNLPYTGELMMGHLRYGTHGNNDIETCHPFLRQSNWKTRALIIAGNFNLTNVDELFQELVDLGQYPKEKSDTVTVLEKIGHFLDDEVQRIHTWHKPDGHSNIKINDIIADELDVQRLLKRASKKFDGGYVMGGMIGHGDAFVMRDPSGIRPAFYFENEEFVAVASERPALQTVFDIHFNEIKEIEPGHALIIKKSGKVTMERFAPSLPRAACSFERIYFSRGTDRDIYLERKELGRRLAPALTKAIDYDFDNTVFSYIPNTAETAFQGMIEGLEKELTDWKKKQIKKLQKKGKNGIGKILNTKVRNEKIVVKDGKTRTFIADTRSRDDMVSHVYDVTYGIVRDEIDTLVLIDDSIVRGTTIRDSIIKIVSRLRPKRIIIVSSAPQIRFPDCYGIDMSKMGEFVAFKAMEALLEEKGKKKLMKQVYKKALEELKKPKEEMENVVLELYNQFSYEEISKKIAQIVTPVGTKPKIDVIYQTVENLRASCPNNNGDWYFSGNYPTPGGFRVVNRAFVNYMEGSNERAY
ncbi:amidophosphoribosyltransferase [Neolewinella lacunae]|uniref:Amidophosphoribosyltransferase n=1 Tax=Neolewinella lacunae TaxID=1517758 RepID=A0A923PS08_9BACT|nr:amidophosphoribosyltransferase [Neolewinella lacunae]MBC6996691.1 amidophosphoribosyltransferase [Neolewinella lacunae]MDN3633444.1 amidophosphoribosyltransferase [Neolewinella lacunae]